MNINMPRDPLIMVAKNVKGDTSKKTFTFTKTQETPIKFWSISDKMKSAGKHFDIEYNLQNYWRNESDKQSQRPYNETLPP